MCEAWFLKHLGKNVTEEGHVVPVLTLSGNCPCWRFSCPSPTLRNPNNKTGLRAFWNHERPGQVLHMLHLPGNRETFQEWRAEAARAPGSIIYCLRRQQCSSVKATRPRAGPYSTRKPPSASTRHWSQQVAPEVRPEVQGGWNARLQAGRAQAAIPHPGILMRDRGECEGFMVILFMCFKSWLTLLQLILARKWRVWGVNS